jgi:hypothetical protein
MKKFPLRKSINSLETIILKHLNIRDHILPQKHVDLIQKMINIYYVPKEEDKMVNSK